MMELKQLVETDLYALRIGRITAAAGAAAAAAAQFKGTAGLY